MTFFTSLFSCGGGTPAGTAAAGTAGTAAWGTAGFLLNWGRRCPWCFVGGGGGGTRWPPTGRGAPGRTPAGTWRGRPGTDSTLGSNFSKWFRETRGGGWNHTTSYIGKRFFALLLRFDRQFCEKEVGRSSRVKSLAASYGAAATGAAGHLPGRAEAAARTSSASSPS